MKYVKNKRIHVLHVVPGLVRGGMELAMAKVITGLSGDDMRHSIACLKEDVEIADSLPCECDIHCFHSRPNEPQLPGRLARLIRRIRPTLIHARNWGAWPDVAVGRFLTRPIVPLVFSFHGLGKAGYMPLRRRLASRPLVRMTTHLFTVSEQTKEMLVAKWGWPDHKVGVIPNGVDTDRFRPGPPRADRQVTVIGSVGGLRAVKNQALLVRACSRLVGNGVDFELRIAGVGPEKDSLIRLAGSLNVLDRLNLCGYVLDVPSFLRDLDLFVLSSDSEAHPNALIEAMACGVPCIATCVGGVNKVLDFGRCGRVVTRGDTKELAEAILGSIQRPQTQNALGLAGREYICDKYSMTRMLAAYRELYERLSMRRLPRRYLATNAGAASARANVPTRDSCSRDAECARVLQLGPLPPMTGGMATVIDNLCNSIVAEKTRLFTLNNGKTTRPGRTLAEGIWAQLVLLCRLIAVLRKRKIQIVHLHTCEFLGFWRDCIHALVAGLCSCHVVWHLHGGGFDKWAARQGRIRQNVIKMAFERASAAIVLSEEWLEKLRLFAPRARWRVVENGIPIPLDSKALSTGLPSFLFLGAWTRKKGVLDLVAATSLAIKKYGFAGIVNLAGFEKEPGQRENLDRVIDESGCRSQINILGLISGRKKDETLEATHCLVLPSYSEGLPIVVLEAMAHGRSIIATKVGAIPGLITEGHEGILIAPGDIEALAKAMARIAADRELACRMGLSARRRVERDYCLEVMARKVMNVYSEVMHSTGNVGPFQDAI